MAWKLELELQPAGRNYSTQRLSPGSIHQLHPFSELRRYPRHHIRHHPLLGELIQRERIPFLYCQ